MANTKITNLEKKKLELEEELERIQDGLDKSIDGVREGVVENLDPKSLIRKYPLQALGASVLVGFLLGKPKSRSGSKSASRRERSDGVGSVIGKELRNALTRKAVSVLLDMIDEQMSSRKSGEEK